MENRRINGVKGGRARLIHIDARVKDIMSLPAIRNRQAVTIWQNPLITVNLLKLAANH
jgi:hypothetical protein